MAEVAGIKYVPGETTSGIPRGLIPTHSEEERIFISDAERMIFPVYRCFDINLGEGRIIPIISPRTIVRDVVETVHPAFPKERYPGKINNVEAKVEALTRFFDMGCGIGILKNAGSMRIKNQIESFPLLGKDDITRILLKCRT